MIYLLFGIYLSLSQLPFQSNILDFALNLNIAVIVLSISISVSNVSVKILELFASKDFFKISENFLFEENTIYGGTFSINLYKGFSIDGTFKNVFYDSNLDGKVDSVPYINLGMKYKY